MSIEQYTALALFVIMLVLGAMQMRDDPTPASSVQYYSKSEKGKT